MGQTVKVCPIAFLPFSPAINVVSANRFIGFVGLTVAGSRIYNKF